MQLALQQELEAQCEQSLDLLLSGFIASLKCHRRGSGKGHWLCCLFTLHNIDSVPSYHPCKPFTD